MKKLLILLIAIALTATAVAQSTAVKTATSMTAAYNPDTEQWDVIGDSEEPLFIIFSADYAEIKNKAGDVFKFNDSVQEESANYERITFIGIDQHNEPVTFAHIFYYPNGKAIDIDPYAYFILVDYLAVDVRVNHLIYDKSLQ